ncbi:hypothetical protein ABQF35_04955 [Mycobacterium syngnathidarum]
MERKYLLSDLAGHDRTQLRYGPLSFQQEISHSWSPSACEARDGTRVQAAGRNEGGLNDDPAAD